MYKKSFGKIMQFQSFIQSGLIFHIAFINRIIIQRISISVDKWIRSPTFYRQQEEDFARSLLTWNRRE